MGRRGTFPVPEEDPVITIGIYLHVEGAQKPSMPVVLSLKKCNPIEGAVVISYEPHQEALMLRDLARIMFAEDNERGFDADFITGWNTDNFDLHYIMTRMKVIGMDRVIGKLMSRIRFREASCIVAFDESAQMGRRQCNLTTIPGTCRLSEFNAHALD